jgi:hypothetical protein
MIRRKHASAAIALSLLLFIAAPARAGLITSTFDTDADGWTSVTLKYPNPGAPPPILGTFTPNWFPTGGTPGGFIYLNDPDGSNATGDTQYWKAPTKFLGNLSAFYGGNLSFDLTDFTAFRFGPFDQEDIILVGGGLTLVYDTPYNPSTGNTWTHYSVGLVPSGWKLNSLSGPPATEADMQTVLGSLEALYIRGEYQLGPDTANLDTVILESSPTAVPEPSSLTLLAAGVFCLASLASRRRKAARRGVRA